MAELHQVLAVDKDLEAASKKIREETVAVFTKQRDHFLGAHKTLTMFDDARTKEAEGLEEIKEIVTTVPKRLEYTAGFVAKHIDALNQKETTNQHAKADIVTENGKTLLKNVPATMLLALEREFGRLRIIYDSMPVLPSDAEWIEDNMRGKGIYRLKHPRITQRTEKTLQVISLAKATKEHKEQVQTINIDKPVGQWTTEMWSSAVPTAQKAEMLARLDELIRSVKKARAEANKEQIKGDPIGQTIFNYLHNAELPDKSI